MHKLGVTKPSGLELACAEDRNLTETELEEMVTKITELIIEKCPDIYLKSYGTDPGVKEPELSIKNQILRRFDDQVGRKNPLDFWRSAVELEFGSDDNRIPIEEDLMNRKNRPDYLKKREFMDAKEVLERQRVEDMFNEMQQDPAFEGKLKEYFSSVHKLSVKNQYERHYDFLGKKEEILDRKNSPLVKNELVDFLYKYSDLKMKMDRDYYSSYAHVDDKKTIHLEQTKHNLLNTPTPFESYTDMPEPDFKVSALERIAKIKDFETKFLKSLETANPPLNDGYKRSVTPAVHGDILNLEFRMNRLKDKGEFGGLHEDYYKNSYESTKVPGEFEMLDARKTAKRWVIEKISDFTDRVMETRIGLEKYLTQEELEKFDYDLKKVMTRDNMRSAALEELQKEISLANVIRRNFIKEEDFVDQIDYEITRWEDYTTQFQKRVKNKDAMERLYAYDSLATLKRTSSVAHKSREYLQREKYTYMMLVEEAMGKDYDYLLHQNLRFDNDTTEYMNKEGFRSGRYVNNEFVARHYGKTFFEDTVKNNTYHNSTTTAEGIDAVLAEPLIDSGFDKYKQYHNKNTIPKKQTVFSNIFEGLAETDDTNMTSKSMSWYFKTINDGYTNKS